MLNLKDRMGGRTDVWTVLNLRVVLTNSKLFFVFFIFHLNKFFLSFYILRYSDYAHALGHQMGLPLCQ